MKKYVIKRADGRDQNVMHAVHNKKEDAIATLLEYLYDHNRHLDIGEKGYASPFDFKLEVIDCEDVNAIISSFESARKSLCIQPLMKICDAKKELDFTDEVSDEVSEGILTFLNELNPHHLDALIALNRLFTLAEAWNKADGFFPNSKDKKQAKWEPYMDAREGKAFLSDVYLHKESTGPYGTRISFKSRERANQFGTAFEELFATALL